MIGKCWLLEKLGNSRLLQILASWLSVADYVEQEDTILLDGFFYRTRGKVRSQLAPQFAEKQVTGDFSMESHLDVSYLRWDDWTEGIGLQEFFSSGGEAPKRAWWSTCELSHKAHLVLAPQLVSIADPEHTTGAPGAQPHSMTTFKDEVYLGISNDIGFGVANRTYKYDNSGDSWGSALNDVTAGVQHQNLLKHGLIADVEHIVHAALLSYAHSTDGTSWTDDTTNIHLVHFWDNRLWLVDIANGNTFYSFVIGTHIQVATLPVPPWTGSDLWTGFTNTLFNATWVDGQDHLMCATGIGLFIYDIENDTWISTNVQWPHNRIAGKGTRVWNGDIYIPAGMGVYRLILGDNQVAVLPVGPDRDHGLPKDTRGSIFQMEAAFNCLIAVMTTDVDDLPNLSPTTLGTILAYDGLGWQVLAQSASGEEFMGIHVSSAAGGGTAAYRLYATSRTTTDINAWYMDLPLERSNPTQVTDKNYAASGTHETPHFRVGNDVTGIALSVQAEVEDSSANETVIIGYDINDSGSFTDFATISSDGITEFPFPNATSPAGTEFRSIRFRVALARGVTTTVTPDLRSLTFKFLKKLPERWTHFVTLDISKEMEGQSPRDQWNNLRTSINKAALLEFTMKDDSTAASTRRHWVRVADRTGSEETGLEYEGEATLVLTEPQHLN